YRDSGGAAPVLFLTGHAQISDKTEGLDAGADDYLTKPFHMDELLARVRALLRRPPHVQPRLLTVRDLTLSPSTRTVSRADKEISLYPKEFALLELFLSHPNQVFSVDNLLDRVWSTDSEAASVDTVRMTILRLRQKIEEDSANPLIQTVRGVGYRLRP
ncbi:MAG: response regulator transcription factor, partial [Terriglobales bacterium]